MSQAEGETKTAGQRRAKLAALLRSGVTTPLPQPLSEGQRAIWYISQLDPQNSSLNLGEAVQVAGGLSRPALERALRALLERHELLRSRVVPIKGELFQVVEPVPSLPLETLITADESEDALARSAGAFIDRAFDLERALPCRFALKRTATGDDVLVFALHHLVGEFASLLILIRELLELYQAAATGADASLPRLTTRYADFVVAQAQYLRDPAAISDAEYWRERLDAPPACLPFPERAGGAEAQSSLVSFELPAATTRAVRELSRSLGVSAYVTLLSAFALLLSRRSGVRELVVGAPMTGRAEARFENVIGYFDNPLPLRVGADPALSVADLIRQVRQTVLGAIEHQRYPLQRIVEDQRSRSNGKAHQLFNTIFVMRQSPRRDLENLVAFGMGTSRTSARLAKGLEVTSVPVHRRRAQFELALSLAEVQGRLIGSWELDRARFSREAVEDLSAAFSELLAHMVHAPDAALGSLSALSAREQAWHLHECNATDGELGPPLLLHEPVEVYMRERRDSVAVIAGSAQLTYGELDLRSRAVAAWLTSQGVSPGEHVAIAMAKGWEQVVAVLGVLRAGAAYLPIDSNLPKLRRDKLLSRAEARLVLVQAPWASADWPEGTRGVDVARLDASHVALPRRAPISPQSLAYTIFTSGSTGEPKGVMISHCGALNTLRDVNQRLGVGPGDSVLGLSALSFDLSVYDIFGVLGVGGTLVLPEAERLFEPEHWVELTRQHNVTLWNSVPSFFKLALEHVESRPTNGAALSSLRAVMLSGDWIPLDLPHRARAACGEHRFISMGGATEGSVWSIWFEVDHVEPSWSSIPYGRPMTNQQFHVLDEHGQPCPVGVTGELYIGGRGLMLGYFRAPELDAHALVTFPQISGRVYRTGDLGRRHSSGVIEFLGRADFQVKVRGFRVELGEVEAALMRHPALSAVAVAAQRRGDENQLVAYLVARSPVEVEELREHSSKLLPQYMVPSAWVFIEALPLSKNGKVDRKALPKVESTRLRSAAPGASNEAAAPPSELLSIVASVLGIATVQPSDDLLSLGADSIQMIRIAAQLQAAGHVVSSRDLFRLTGLGALAEHLGRSAKPPGQVPSTPWQLQALNSRTTRSHCVLAHPQRLDPAHVSAAWARLVEAHEALRLDVGPEHQRLVEGEVLDHRKQVDVEHAIEDAEAKHRALSVRDGARLSLICGAAESRLLLSAPPTLTDAFGFRALVVDLVQALTLRPTGPAEPTRSFLSWAASGFPTSTARAESDVHRSFPTSAFASLQLEAKSLDELASKHRLSLPELALLALDRSRPDAARRAVIHARHDARSGDAPRVAPASWDQRYLLGRAAPDEPCLRRLAQLQASRDDSASPCELALVVVDRNDAPGALERAGFSALGWTDQAVVDRVEACVVLLEREVGRPDGQLIWRCWSTTSETPETTLSRLCSGLTEVLRELQATPTKTEPRHFPLADLDSTDLERLLARYPRLEDIWSLGPMQQTMLTHAAVDQTPGLYCHHVHWDISGELDLTRFQQAFDQLLRGLPNLRVAFELLDVRVPVQVVLPLRSPAFSVELAACGEWDAATQRIIAADRATGFDLRCPPLLRVTVLKADVHLHRVVICHHHLLFDGWSIGLLQEQLLAAYGGGATRAESSPGFASFVAWSRAQSRADLAAHWRPLLEGTHATTPLRFQDFRPSPQDAFVHGELEAHWDESFVASLEKAARASRVTPGSAMLSAWGLLLSRCAERDDVVFGVTGSGRPEGLDGASGMVGLLINSVPLRLDLSQDRSLAQLMQEVQAQYAASRLNEQIPLRELAALAGARDFRPFDTLVIFENFATRRLEPTAGVTFSPFRFSEQINAPLAIYVLPGPTWTLRVAYDAARFSPATVTALVTQLRTCLEHFTTDADRPIHQLSLATAASERLRSFNETSVRWEDGPTLCQLLAERASRWPEAVAVVAEGQPLSYDDLHQRARAWARLLVDRGVRPGDRVAVLCRRSAAWIVTLYAILETGACYVPLDEAAPVQRNRAVLVDAGVALLVADRASLLATGLDESNALVVDELTPPPLAQPSRAGVPLATAESAAYLIYTSGSTGTPKGVAVSHGAVVNYALGTRKTYGFEPRDRVLQFFSPAFDGAFEEIFGALASGAALVLRAEDALSSFTRLGLHLQEERVSVVSLPTAVWHAWTTHLDESGERLPNTLRTVIIGGERAIPARVAAWRRIAARDPVRLFNSYGPTETTIVALIAELTDLDLDAERGREVPIGRPVPNVECFVVDRRGRLCPEGAPGELLIGGAGLAIGYWQRADLTAQRFAPIPELPHQRLYHTGDRVRFRDDGQLEFLGRFDEQVKVRGYRVELGEVEHALLQCSGVRQAVVSTQASTGDHLTLVAHVVATDHAAESLGNFPARLREQLRARLPGYMVPAAIAIIDALPLNERGKLDRKRLPSVKEEDAGAGRLPGSPKERAIAKVWAEALGLSSVDVEQDFFEAGGHSLAALRLLGRLQQELGIQISLRDLYAAPTVAALAALAEGGGKSDDGPVTQMASDARLSLPKYAEPTTGSAPPRKVLLTGATGFLGTFVLGELLASTSADIWCLARDGHAAFARIERALRRAGLWRHDAVTRVRPIAGDLGAERLGLSDADYRLLAEGADSVLHNGARVSFVEPYEVLRAPNVLGTRSILELCATGRPKSLHYVSTLAVFDANQASASIAEGWLPEAPSALPSGYGQSKWVAERLVTRALHDGLRGAVYRPGRISGHSLTGAWQEDDLACQMLAACAAVGLLPDLDMLVDLTPVDYVARAIVGSLGSDETRQVLHLTNPDAAPLQRVGELLAESGLPLRRVDLGSWCQAVRAVSGEDPSHAWTQLTTLIALWQDALRPPQHGEVSFQTQRTHALLAKREVRCPSLDRRLLETYVGWLRQRGLLPLSQEAG